MQRARVRGVAREEPGVAVARAEQRDDPQHPDEELVALERRGTLRECVHLRR